MEIVYIMERLFVNAALTNSSGVFISIYYLGHSWHWPSDAFIDQLKSETSRPRKSSRSHNSLIFLGCVYRSFNYLSLSGIAVQFSREFLEEHSYHYTAYIFHLVLGRLIFLYKLFHASLPCK